MRKSFKILTPMILFILGFLLWSNRLPGWNAAEELPWKYRFQIQQEIRQAEALLEGASAPDIDTMETLLMEAGYSVLDTDAIYPTYLANPDTLTDFWINASAGQNASCSFFISQRNPTCVISFSCTRITKHGFLLPILS